MMLTRRRVCLAIALVVAGLGSAGCGPSAPGGGGAAVPPPAPAVIPFQPADLEPPTLRLPNTARPLRYDLDLTIDPARDTFTGTIGIDLELARAASAVWLNATDLVIDSAKLTVGDQVYGLRTITGGEDFVGLALPEPKDPSTAGDVGPVGPGRARLVITYSGKLDGERSRGIYREKEGDAWYAYTFFEPLDARRAFPCFDEPNYKVPWKLVIHTPRGNIARANEPVEGGPRAGEAGMDTFAFTESPPMPSYLVAFVVGPFDIVDAPPAGQHGTRLQFIVPRGRGGETAYAAEVTPRIVTLLEDYTGMPYPYRKLDVAVVPRFWGTMEHPGIVAMGQPLTLIKPEEDTTARRRSYANIGIHELAHYWFGDYVTMAWWDDTWLNEALATWMDVKLTAQLEPSWEFEMTAIFAREAAMSTDSLPTAKKLREPVVSKHEIADSFDGAITYDKGSRVLGMFEQWAGEEAFQRAIRAYLAEYAWGNADSEGFVRAISRELPAPYGPAFADAFRTFLDQPGAPLVTVELDCAAGDPALVLSQRQFTAAGTPPSDRLWQIPVCVTYGFRTAETRVCELLTERTARFPLIDQRAGRRTNPRPGAPASSAATGQGARAGRCPDWVLGNTGGLGYYRVAYPERLTRALLAVPKDRLTTAERVASVLDLTALVVSGDVQADALLAMVPDLVREGNRHLVYPATGLVAFARDLAPDALANNFARFVRAVYAAPARKLGWKPKPGEDHNTTELRPLVMSLMTVHGRSPALRREALRLARAYLGDRSAVHPTMARAVLSMAAQVGDAALFDAYFAEAQEQTDHREKARFIVPLGQFRQPMLIMRALAMLLDTRYDMRDVQTILYTAASHDEHPELAYAFVRDNFDALVARMRSDEAAALAIVVARLCDDDAIAAAERDFGDKFKAFDGGPRELANALDRARRCAAVKKIQQPSVAAFLRKW